MADEVVIDKDLFHERLSSLLTQWKTDKRSGDATFLGVGSIVACVGKPNEGHYTKSAALQLWLLGYEFPSTLFLFTPENIHIVTTKKKAAYLESLKGGKVPVELHIRGKDAEANAKIFEDCLNVIKEGGSKVGVLPKDGVSGPFVDEWKAAFEKLSKDIEEVDVASSISNVLSVKDETELRAIRDGSKASSLVMANYFVEEMSSILDQEKKVTHRVLASKVGDVLENQKFWQMKDNKVSSTFDSVHLDWDLQPTVQSGGKYDLKFNEEPDDKTMKEGVIIAALGFRYKSYSSAVARTYMVDPTKTQEGNYKLLLQIYNAVMDAVRPGVQAKEVYNKALSIIKSKKPELEKHFLKNVGYGIGIESRDPQLVLNAKNSRVLKDGMTLNITVGFQDIKDKDGPTYALVLSDTIRVEPNSTLIFTRDAPTDANSVCFFFNESDEEEQKKAPKKDKQQKSIAGRSSAIAQKNTLSTRLRGERSTNQNEEKERARQEHQAEVHKRKQREGLEKYGKNVGSLNGVEEKKFKKFDSYKRDDQFPSKVRDLAIVVDERAQTVVLPIMGRPVPFHINTIKNASTTNDGEFTSIRINFLSPGQGVGRKDDQPFEDPTAHFVRSLTFRSKDKDRMERISTQITDLKKEIIKKEVEKKQLEDVVEQEKLIVAKGNRPQVLDMVFMRPGFDGKRVPGRVEIHQNGVRYVHFGGQVLDVPFSNIKHLFFQPSEHELIVIIHLHLINPIMIGKRKSKDVQFYREATEMQFDETGNRKRRHNRMNDEDEYEQEQEERRRRAELDNLFHKFAKKIQDSSKEYDLKVDQPFRGISFNGVPVRSSVLIQPTTDCLVQLTEPPFTVLTMSEVEVIHLERVQFGLKNFDLVVIFKDYNRPPYHINTIPVEALDTVKDWIDSIEIPFSEGPVNLQWAPIMKAITADPHQFYVDGGWSFLGGGEESEDEEESEEESAFEVSDEELAESESESEEDSDFDENASAEASEEDMSGESDEGEDWDELEKKAKKKDRESGLDDEETAGKKRKR